MICEYLWEQIPDTVAPRFIGDLPSQSEEGIALSLQEGEENTLFFGQKDYLSKPRVQCFVRSEQYTTGENWANAVIDALHEFHSDEVLACTLVSSLAYLGRNEDKLHEFQVMFKLLLKE